MKSTWRTLKRLHTDEQGVVSLETILIVGAIALPILIFLIKVGWPTIQKYFTNGLNELQTDATNAAQDPGTGT
jgi:Flp pilus assembly pilin Flp